jgi:hypothetical protein
LQAGKWFQHRGSSKRAQVEDSEEDKDDDASDDEVIIVKSKSSIFLTLGKISNMFLMP